jgi:hypothetical protein
MAFYIKGIRNIKDIKQISETYEIF